MSVVAAHRSSLAVQRAQPGAAPAGPTLSDLVRVLDVDTLAAMFNGLTFKELGQIRLACRALREACASFVRRFDVRVNHRTAQNWRPGQRSPLSLFPWCSELKLSISVEKPDPYRDWQAANSDDDDDEQMFRYPADSNYSHHHLARLALAGVRAEALARIRKLTVFNFSMTYGNMGFDLAGVLCALAPQLPALEVLGVSYAWQLAGMKAADRARPTMIYQALAQHCPRLRELRLPAAPGMLHGVDALAACGGLTAFESWESARGHDGAIILGAAEVEALSQLTQLRTLKLRCHDRSAGGAHLVALLGARRWPQLQELKLAASVRVTAAAGAAAAHRRLQMPQIELTLQPGSGRDIQELWLQPCCTGECGPLAFEAAARVLMAAVDLAPPDAPRSRIHSLRVAGLPVTKHSCSEADAVKCLEPAGHLARLAARCGQVHVEHLDAKRAVSVSALCAVLGVLGMPALLKLQHGFWVVRPSPAPSEPPPPLLPPRPRAGDEQLPSPLRLESATPEAVLREAVERLWLMGVATVEAATAGAAEAGPAGLGAGPSEPGARVEAAPAISAAAPADHDPAAASAAADGAAAAAAGDAVADVDPGVAAAFDRTVVLLRGVTPPPPKVPRVNRWHHVDPAPVAAWLDGLVGGGPAAAAVAAAPAGAGAGAGAEAGAGAAGVAEAGAAATAVAAGAAAAGEGAAAAGASRFLDQSRDYKSMPCAGAVMVQCETREAAAALVAAVAAAAAVAGSGGSAGRTAEAALLPHGVTEHVAGPRADECVAVMDWAVMRVLQELWAGRAQGELADDQPAAPSGHPGPLSGADLRLLQRLLDLDAGVCKLHQGDSA
ncbi:hypothetical protein CHLRE_07g319200v5 [Chlamydomonas reinhardtii]|uniref:F-box domain-containing protein n=1 Tax=Chlamydomonas reinhardtii TaxID=3055 RepID=A0A2K3DIW9_CHLRE|nr:uncharacterized protein CHLRE_07g319200v5 [Chlamydomonas reinhardtii]PNW80479.1 hypothetical protein CHLRE_07g319200v5 [Chlamydomonas reinhardtii]